MSESIICIFHKQLLLRNTHIYKGGREREKERSNETSSTWIKLQRMNEASQLLLILLWKSSKNIEIRLFWQLEQHSSVCTCLRIIVIYLITLKSLKLSWKYCFKGQWLKQLLSQGCKKHQRRWIMHRADACRITNLKTSGSTFLNSNHS